MGKYYVNFFLCFFYCWKNSIIVAITYHVMGKLSWMFWVKQYATLNLSQIFAFYHLSFWLFLLLNFFKYFWLRRRLWAIKNKTKRIAKKSVWMKMISIQNMKKKKKWMKKFNSFRMIWRSTIKGIARVMIFI